MTSVYGLTSFGTNYIKFAENLMVLVTPDYFIMEST